MGLKSAVQEIFSFGDATLRDVSKMYIYCLFSFILVSSVTQTYIVVVASIFLGIKSIWRALKVDFHFMCLRT